MSSEHQSLSNRNRRPPRGGGGGFEWSGVRSRGGGTDHISCRRQIHSEQTIPSLPRYVQRKLRVDSECCTNMIRREKRKENGQRGSACRSTQCAGAGERVSISIGRRRADSICGKQCRPTRSTPSSLPPSLPPTVPAQGRVRVRPTPLRPSPSFTCPERFFHSENGPIDGRHGKFPMP